MTALSDQLRRAIGAPPPAEPVALQRLRDSIQHEVEQVERERPGILRAIRQQQEDLQRQGMLR